MLALFTSNPLTAIPKERQRETARYLKRIEHHEPSPFYLACAEGNDALVEETLATQPVNSLDQLEPTGETPLHIATRNNHPKIVRLLLQSGFSQNTFNSSDKLPYQEAQTEEMRQLYARTTPAHFFEENPKNSHAFVKRERLAAPSVESSEPQTEGIATVEDPVAPTRRGETWNEGFTSEEQVLRYLTNRQTFATWLKFCAWLYRHFGGIIGRREEAGDDFAPELFDLDKDRDLRDFFQSIQIQPSVSLATANNAHPDREQEEQEQTTWRQRLLTACCCHNSTAPAPTPSSAPPPTTTVATQPNIEHRKRPSLIRMKRQLASTHDPRDFVQAAKDLNSITPLIYLYTRHDIPFYSALNKQLATIDSKRGGGSSLCDRFIQEFDLKESELAQFAFTGVTYRGTSMSEDDVATYREGAEQHPKCIFAPRAFQSTSVNRAQSMKYLQHKKQKGNAVGLLRFHVPVPCSTIFSVQEISAFPEEEEVLIMPGNLFAITKVTQCEEDPTVPEVHLEHIKREISFWKKLRTIYRAATVTATGID